ncbi:unnamed protein product [Acidithrix sp. C25]|nr:unnamed protein product [Acidithrix sp. C25]
MRVFRTLLPAKANGPWTRQTQRHLDPILGSSTLDAFDRGFH